MLRMVEQINNLTTEVGVVGATAMDLCHGAAGGGTYALNQAGATVVGGCEKDRQRHQQYTALHGEGTECMDVVEYVLLWATLGGPPVALMLLCAPCQCFMTLGTAHPLGAHDSRECVLPTIKALVSLKPHQRPESIVIENTPLIQSWGGGCLYDDVADHLFAMGYLMVLCMVKADGFGLAAKRKRLYTVALPNQGALERFATHLPQASGVCGRFVDVSSKDVHLWGVEGLRVDMGSLLHAMTGRCSLESMFCVVSCHYRQAVNTIITRGGDSKGLGYGTYVLLTHDAEPYWSTRFTAAMLREPEHRGLQVRTLTCAELCLLQGSPIDTTSVHGEGKPAHAAWGEAVAVPCAAEVCKSVLLATRRVPVQRTGGSSVLSLGHPLEWNTVGRDHPQRVMKLKIGYAVVPVNAPAPISASLLQPRAQVPHRPQACKEGLQETAAPASAQARSPQVHHCTIPWLPWALHQPTTHHACLARH